MSNDLNEKVHIDQLGSIEEEDSKFFSFVPLFKEYCRLSTDAPRNFGEITAIQILGHALGHEVVHLIQPHAVRHNMYGLLVGPSTISRKNTIQDLGKSVYPMNRWIATETSPESLLEILSEQNEGFQWLGEFSGLTKGIRRGGYMARFAEIYNDLIGCQKYSRRLRTRNDVKTSFVIEKPYLSVHSTITPVMLKEYLNTEMVSGGFLPRWLIMNGKPDPKPRGRLHEDVAKWNEVLKNCVNIILSLEKNVAFVLSDKALYRFNEIEKIWYKRDKILPFIGRYENYLIAIADILLVSDSLGVACSTDSLRELAKLTDLTKLTKLINNGESCSTSISPVKAANLASSASPIEQVIVPTKYIELAHDIINPCLDAAEYYVEYVEVEKVEAKIMDLLKRFGSIGHTNLLQRSHTTAREFAQAIKTLEEKALVRIEKEEIERIGMKTKRIYHWLGKKES